MGKRFRLYFKALKCKFFQTKLPYLGHILNNGTILPDPSKVQAIKDFPQPTNVKSLRTFLSMAQFCDRFIRNFSVILAPLHELTRHHNTFKWTSSCQEAFEKVKQLLVEHPVLHPPSSDSIFILETDASDVGVSHCPKALDPDGPVTDLRTFVQSFPDTEYIVGYGSRKFNDTERGWSIVEKEASAIMDVVRKHRHYLIGKKFLLRVDNRVLTYLMSKREPKSCKLLSWALELGEYDFDIEHVESKNNAIADCLSCLHLIALLSALEPEFSHEEFHKAQCQDSYLKAAFEYLAVNRKHFDVHKLGPFKQCRKQLHLGPNGLLYWKNCLVVPETLRTKTLELCHDNPASGHFAIDRTLSRFKSKFFWPKALEDVTSWVRGCVKCNQFNTPPGGYVRAPLKPIESSERFQTVCYDIAGPFMPITPRGNKYALILVDHFTKWSEVVALPDIQAPIIARAIYDQ